MSLLWAEKYDRYNASSNIGDYNEDAGSTWTVQNTGQISLLSTDGPYADAAVKFGPNGKIALPFGAKSGGNATMIFSGDMYYEGGTDGVANAGVTLHGPVISAEVNSALNAGLHWGVEIAVGDGIYILNAASAIVARVPHAIVPRTWHHVEVVVVCSNSGTMTVKIDGVQIVNLSGQDFLNGSNVNGAYLMWRGIDGGTRFHDVIVADGNGSLYNSACPQHRLESQLPDADGSPANWTPSTGSNYQCIDDALNAASSDTDYISSSTTDQDNYASHAAFTMPGLDDIGFMMVTALARSDTTGDELALMCKSNGDVTQSADRTLANGTYRYRTEFFPLDPDTAAAWASLTAVNAAEYGVRKRV